MRSLQRDFESEVDEIHEILMRLFPDPDPVDVFEDDLAQELVLVRDPALPCEEWRRLRVQFVDAADAKGGGLVSRSE